MYLSKSGQRGELIDCERKFNNYLYSITKNEITDYFRSLVISEPLDSISSLKDSDHTDEMIESVYDLSHIKNLVMKEVDNHAAAASCGVCDESLARIV
ncbi:MAG: hypothetical protein ACLURQ_04335 [Bacteroides thetaiotaomicron]